MKKFYHSIAAVALTVGMMSSSAWASPATATPSSDVAPSQMGVVNFRQCVEMSKLGQQERASLESLQTEIQGRLEAREKELETLAQNLSDPDFVDGLSAKAEEDMRAKFQTLSQEQARDQNHFFQMLNQAHYKIMQAIAAAVSQAASTVAQAHQLSVVLNEEAAFYYSASLDVTSQVIAELDRLFDAQKLQVVPAPAPDAPNS